MPRKPFIVFYTTIFIIFHSLIASAQDSVDISSILAHKGISQKGTSIMVANADTGLEMASFQPDLALNPASCAKIITSAAALNVLGPSYQFRTYFYSDSKPENGRIKTLYIAGQGDPSLVNEYLDEIGKKMRSLGIKKIEDGIVLDNSFFDSYNYPRKDTGEGRAYTANTSATPVNHNSIGIEIGPGPAAGRAGIVTTDPPTDYFKIINKFKTGGKFSLNLNIAPDNGRETITAAGRVPARFTPQKFYRSVANPALYTGAIARYWLIQNGIETGQGVREGRVPPGAHTVLIWQSRPLSEIIALMNKKSNNFIAEQILKHMGAVKFGVPGSTSKGVLAVENYLSSIGIKKGAYAYENGSGLSEITQISARQLVKILSSVYSNGKTRNAMVESLSVLGIDGTTQKWRVARDIEGMAYVKTGTINNVSTLAGYVKGNGGKTAAFAILINGLPRGVGPAHQAELALVKEIVEK